MAFYLVRARLRPERLEELRARLARREFEGLRPFGRALTKGLVSARRDPDTGDAVWEEEDYCSPPLQMERDAVLDHYCEEIRVEMVAEGEGWTRITHLPSFWDAQRARTGRTAQ